MGDRPSNADVQQAPPPQASGQNPNLLEQSGFLDRMRKVRDTAGDATRNGLDKGKEVLNNVRNSEAAGQIVDRSKQVINSPTTKRITGEVVEQGKEIGREKAREVRTVVDAGKRGDVKGVIKGGAPLVKDALLGPEALALKLAKDKAFEVLLKNAPPDQRDELVRAKQAFDRTSRITNPRIAQQIEDQLMQQALDKALDTASDPNARRNVVEGVKETASKTGRFFRGVGEKLHVVKPREQADSKR